MPLDTTPSTTATAALQGIPFSALIGGPLGAAVNAQVQSAKATIDFIQNVGLTGPPEDRKAIQIEFIYYVDGREVKLLVPLLTILPIPYLAVNEVDISFKASINASSSTYQEDSSQTQTDAKGGADIKFGWGPVSGNAHFEASYSSKKDSKATSESKYSVEYTMDVHVHAGQEDMPAGLARVLNILTDSIAPTAKQANIQVSPATLTAADPTQDDQNLLVTATLYDEKGMRTAGKNITVAVIGTAPTSPIIQLPTPVPTDENGTTEFEIKIEKVTTAATSSRVKTQRVKLKLSSTDPAASKTITLMIPEFTVPSASPPT